MAKKIKFPLEMAEGVNVRTLEELREHFDLEKIIAYYTDGSLMTWLNDRYYEDEVSQISQLDSNSPDFKKKLRKTLGVDIEIDCEIDFEAIERRNAKLSTLKLFTGDLEVIRNVDSVAFDQEEMADLLDEDVSPIYLCGERFTIPLSKENVIYIGVNSPVAVINSKTAVDFAAKNIQFQKIIFNEEYSKIAPKKEEVVSYKSSDIKGVYEPSYLSDLIKCGDKKASAKIFNFNIIHSELAGLEFDIDKYPNPIFDMLLTRILNALDLYNWEDYAHFFKEIYVESTPLFMFFDTTSGNEYVKSIFNNAGGIIPKSYLEKTASEKIFSNNLEKKIHLVNAAIKGLHDQYDTRWGTESYRYIIFFALLAACMDKTDFDEKNSMIADFAYMTGISENILFDITQVIKIIFGEIELWHTDRAKLDSLWGRSHLSGFWVTDGNPEGFKKIFTARTRHDDKETGVIFKTSTVPRDFNKVILLMEDNVDLRINKKQTLATFSNVVVEEKEEDN